MFSQDGQEQQPQQQPAPRPSPWAVIKTLAVRMLFVYFIASMFRRSPTTPSNDSSGAGSAGVRPATNLFEKGTIMVGGITVRLCLCSSFEVLTHLKTDAIEICSAGWLLYYLSVWFRSICWSMCTCRRSFNVVVRDSVSVIVVKLGTTAQCLFWLVIIQ